VIIEWDSDGHNGAALAFGPDGMLYVSSGDGSTDSDMDLAGQDLTRLRSKISEGVTPDNHPGRRWAIRPMGRLSDGGPQLTTAAISSAPAAGRA
jgi:glucose/arabinose dehydrogenase